MSERYGLDPQFEQVVAVMCAQRPRFLGKVGYALDPEAFKSTTVQLIVKATQAIFRESGTGPSSASVVLQRLRRWMQEGVVTKEEIDKAADLFVDAPIPLPTDDEVIGELSPIIKRRAESDAIKMAMEDFSNKRPLDRTKDIIGKSERIGLVDKSLGMHFDVAGVDVVAASASTTVMPLGIMSLDGGLGGGLRRGNAMAFGAGPGKGKSFALAHVAAFAIAHGLCVGYVTLELTPEVVFTRIACNLVHVSLAAALDPDPLNRDPALKVIRRRMGKVAHVLGKAMIKELPAKVSTMVDVRAWVAEAEESMGCKFDLLVIDYADKLRSHRKEDKNLYEAMGTVFEDFRLFVQGTNKWGVTATQTTRASAKSGDAGRRVEATDIADSIEKLRVLDLLVTLRPDNDAETIVFHVGKNRHGPKDNWETAPEPYDWTFGRMVKMEKYYGRVGTILVSR